jgi:hypothetical protein
MQITENRFIAFLSDGTGLSKKHRCGKNSASQLSREALEEDLARYERSNGRVGPNVSLNRADDFP